MKSMMSDIFSHAGMCLLLTAGCLPAMGEQPDSVYTDLMELEVVANKVKEDVTSTAPLFRLSDEKMKSMGVTDLTDALHRMPGLNIRDYGGAGGMKTVSVRGFGTTHTGVIYDGVTLSDAQSGTIDLSRYCLIYKSPSPRDKRQTRMPSSA